ncbi:MAG: secretin N-terminal domain-containing protein [bacterium]
MSTRRKKFRSRQTIHQPSALKGNLFLLVHTLLVSTFLAGIVLLIVPGSGSTAEDMEGAYASSAMSIRDMDINTLLKALSMKYRANIVSTPEVKGRISLNLKEANLEDSLTAIARIMGLIWTKEGSLYILSQGEKEKSSLKEATEKDQGEAGKEEEKGIDGKEGKEEKKDVLRSVKVFHINYADIKELSKVIQWSFEKSEGTKPRTTVYPQEGMLLVEGSDKELEEVERIIRSLDIPPEQAMIEAQILEINLSDDMTYGIDWSGTFSQGGNADGYLISPGQTALPPGSISGDSSSQGNSQVSYQSLSSRDTSQFLFGVISPHFYFKLNALEKKGDVKTLAKPRILVLDGKAAQILIGGKLGYYLTTTTQTSTMQSVEFLDIGTQLKLTPHIAEDGNILLNIQPEVSDGVLSGGLPQKTTTSVTTSVMVKAGETIFIGGLIRNSEIKARGRLPVLGKIPILGRLLFSKSSTQTQRKELVILLTPYLVSSCQKPDTGREQDSPPSDPSPGKGREQESNSGAMQGETGSTVQKEMKQWQTQMDALGNLRKESNSGAMQGETGSTVQKEMKQWQTHMDALGNLGKESKSRNQNPE